MPSQRRYLVKTVCISSYGSEFSDRVPQNVKLPQAINSPQIGESPVPSPEMLSGFHRHARWNASRSHARQQSRLFRPLGEFRDFPETKELPARLTSRQYRGVHSRLNETAC